MVYLQNKPQNPSKNQNGLWWRQHHVVNYDCCRFAILQCILCGMVVVLVVLEKF